MKESASWKLPEAVFSPEEDSITPQPFALVKASLDAAIKSNMVKPDSYRICPETNALIVSAGLVNQLALEIGTSETRSELHRQIANIVVGQAFAQHFAMPQPVYAAAQLATDTIPVMLSA